MLATKGVFNEPRPCPVETVRVVGEDTDVSEYELRDGEETPVAGKDGDLYPVGQTYVLKAGPEPVGGSQTSSAPLVVSSELDAEQRIERDLREMIALCERVMSGAAGVQKVQSVVNEPESDSHPIPDSCEDDDDRGDDAETVVCPNT
jgi:hypothetical protein